ncbi:hypothetical protein [Burkholderia ubonensis]|uniref:Uncharacterized protein n=1 Tax=Burkholderia ubonensis TaxID=101571 RepID=A0ABD4EBU6_9BURK|nr:hypothetical protein [Burkholderia ubonensis]KVN92585.1 hypothetical protein WJ68_33740 [Burkholderia ubonensis]
MSEPQEQVDRRFMDQLLALSKRAGSPVDHDVYEWLMSRGFARAQNLPTDPSLGGLVITQAGIDWLKITKYTG